MENETLIRCCHQGFDSNFKTVKCRMKFELTVLIFPGLTLCLCLTWISSSPSLLKQGLKCKIKSSFLIYTKFFVSNIKLTLSCANFGLTLFILLVQTKQSWTCKLLLLKKRYEMKNLVLIHCLHLRLGLNSRVPRCCMKFDLTAFIFTFHLFT